MTKTTTPEIELSIVLPCLNEAETLKICVNNAQRFLQQNSISGEVLIADNGSTDRSLEIAAEEGARLVNVSEKGYGNALLGGIKAANGRYVIMGDADNSYDFSNLGPFVQQLRGGYELVMGNRFRGGIKKGAMPALHRYIGNPILTGIGRLFFHSPCGDFHCGLRGFKRDSILSLDLRTPGMEFASEMVVKATLHGLRITEVPTTLSPDGRSRPPHLRSWRDGWRHLRFLLLFCPHWLFAQPGRLLMAIGIVGYFLAMPAMRIGGVSFGLGTLMFASLAILCGQQAIFFAIGANILGVQARLLKPDYSSKNLLASETLERGLLFGLIAISIGLALLFVAVIEWGLADFGSLDAERSMRLIIPGATLVAFGIQTLFDSFFLSVLRKH